MSTSTPPSSSGTSAASDPRIPAPWWVDAVFYQVYPRSFRDSDGDGVGDLRGITAGLDHLVDLGVDAIWLSPILRSPQVDHGYDVSDYCDIDPMFGTLADFDALLARAHELGLRLIMDIVPNHCSDQHPWFQAALADPNAPERAHFIFRPGRGRAGELPPSNHESAFGGPAWTRVPGEPTWYYHMHDAAQPDFDWTDPGVAEEFDRVLRFWLDRGVDGLRIDVGDHLSKGDVTVDAADADAEPPPAPVLVRRATLDKGPDSPTHAVFRRWRRILDSYPGDRMAVLEAFGEPTEMAGFVRPDEPQLYFNFPFMHAGWDAAAIRACIESSLAIVTPVGARATWVIDSHDEPRSLNRLGGGPAGLARSAALTLVMLALPGVPFVYQGQELGLPNHDQIPDDRIVDPIWERSGHTRRGRDGSRVPLPWSGEAPSYGFSTAYDTWLPQPSDWASMTIAAQDRPDSFYARVRAMLALRRAEPALGRGALTWLDAPADVVAFSLSAPADRPGRALQVWLNLGAPIPMPRGDVLISSGAGRSVLGTDEAAVIAVG